MSVSVIIPVYNGERYLAESIESVLAQTEVPIELIVVDDGSQDGSQEIVRRFGSSCKYVYQTNQGAASAKNTGIALAQGQFLSFNDADDLWAGRKLALQWEAFKANPALDMVFGHVLQFYSPELSDDFKKRIACPAQPMPCPTFNTMLIKRSSFDSVGLFSNGWTIGEGIDWASRAMEKKLVHTTLAETLVHRRIHENNQGMRRRSHYLDYVEIAKASLDRRRNHA